MQHLAELQERILAVLEEPGEENVFTILNTVSNPEGQQKEELCAEVGDGVNR